MEKYINTTSSLSHEEDTDIFDIKKVISNLLSNWYYFAIGLLVTLSLAFLYILFANPVYEVNAGIMVEDQKGTNSGTTLPQSNSMFNDLGGAFSMTSTVENEEQILQSRSLMYRVVRDLQLNISYFDKQSFGMKETYENTPYNLHLISIPDSLITFTLRWKQVTPTTFELYDANNKKVVTAKYGAPVKYNNCVFTVNRNQYVNVDKNDDDHFYFQLSSYDMATTKYQKSLVITVPSDKANAIDISISTNVPSKGEFVMNYFIQRYLRSSLEQRNQIADSTLSFISTRLGIVANELGNVENQVALYKGTNKIISPDVQAQLMASTYNESYKLGSQIDLQLDVINNLKQYIGDESNNKRIVPSNLVTSDPTFSQLVGKYNTLMVERDRISLNYPDTNPLLQNLDMQLSNLRKDMVNNLASTQSNLASTKSHLQTTDRSLNSRIFTAPSIDKGFLELSREQKIKEALYLFLVQRREEVAIARSSNVAKATVIDDPKALSEPTSPNKPIIYIVAFILGLFIPSITLYTRSILNTRVLSREDIHKRTNVAVLAELGHKVTPDILVTHNTSRSQLAEQFRTLRANLQFIMKGRSQNVIMITSSMAGEGKTFVSLNLANVLALTQKRVLLVDMDLRKPKILKSLNLPAADGITNYLNSDISVENIILESGLHPNLFVVGTGPSIPNPSELLLNPRMEEFFAYAKSHFDYIVVDTAPVGVISDAQILSVYANVSLYVVRQKKTLKDQLYIIEDMHETKKIDNLYILLNDVKSQSRYGYGSGVGYANGNGYYEKQGKSKPFTLNKFFTRFSES